MVYEQYCFFFFFSQLSFFFLVLFLFKRPTLLERLASPRFTDFVQRQRVACVQCTGSQMNIKKKENTEIFDFESSSSSQSAAAASETFTVNTYGITEEQNNRNTKVERKKSTSLHIFTSYCSERHNV